VPRTEAPFFLCLSRASTGHTQAVDNVLSVLLCDQTEIILLALFAEVLIFYGNILT
jgi:hypothetical protein